MNIAAVISGLSAASGLANSIANTTLSAEINKRNFELQQQHFDYEKDLQQQIFQREDTAIQRRMADLKAAGLSPLLAAGGEGAGAGTPIATETPQQQFTPVDWRMDLNQIMSTGVSVAASMQQIQTQREQNLGLKLDNELKRLEVDNAKIHSAHKAQLDIARSEVELNNLKKAGKISDATARSLEQSIKMDKERLQILGLDKSIRASEKVIYENQAKASTYLEQKAKNETLYGMQLAREKTLNNNITDHDVLFYRNLEKQLGLPFPINNYRPLEFAGDTMQGLFDNIMDILTLRVGSIAGKIFGSGKSFGGYKK